MPERVSDIDVRALHEEAAELLQTLRATTTSYGPSGAEDLPAIARAAQLALTAAVSGLGECREETPYAPLYPVRENGEFKWCCTHRPPHCS